MRPEDERDDLPAGDDAAEHELPPPATWAGRRRAGGAPAAGEPSDPDATGDDPSAGEPADADGAALDAPADAEGGDARSGFTDEYEAIERDLDQELGELADEDADVSAEDLSQEDIDELDDEDELAAAAAEDEAGPAEPAAGGETDAGVASQMTMEADTLALADKVEAEEAALAALRARAAQSAAPDAGKAAADSDAPGAEEASPAGTAEPQAAGPEPAEAEPSEPPPGGEPVAAGVGAGEPDEGKTPRAKPIWLRFLTASVVIVASMAAATSISLLVYLTDIARGLEDNGLFAKIADQLDEVEGGDPQTILILGSDKRPNEETGRSDTTILLRVDPDNNRVALLSIPRDLKVNIPGHGTDKLNAAYAIGGPDKTFQVVKRLVGIPIHHVVNINFRGFADAVNAIGCVYIDVDRRYFIPPEDDIAEIDIEAGYQRLCGLKALQYVRFRHEDTDLVRSARQQDFLREARQKLSPEQIVRDSGYRKELTSIFTEYTTSDISSGTELLELIKTFLGAADATVNEVHFPAKLGGPNSAYVDASPRAIKKAVDEFLNGEGTPGPAPAGKRDDDGGDSGGKKKKKKGKDKPKPEPKPAEPPMEDSSVIGEQVAMALQDTRKKSGKPMLDFPVMYPTRILPGSELQTVEGGASRAFPIDGPADDVYHGYKIVLDYVGQGGFNEYYGISGTDWLDAPILENPSERRKIDGREYLLYYDGDRLRMVAWKTKQAAYWVQNTLAQALDEDVMLSIATSMRKVGG